MIELSDIKSPDDLKGLSVDDLKGLACDIRKEIIGAVSAGGGHLASSLGVVELTLAMHHVFNSPEDRIIWDVGHQSYAHKLLTGRLDKFHTLRKYKGISGFPRMIESPHDAFGTGHSSTSISAAIGMCAGRDHKADKYKVIAVIGDGALTAGLAFEGLNHAGQLGKDLIVILNDNEMSISPNVGAMSLYLNRILTGNVYNRVKNEMRKFIEGIPKFGGPMARFAEKAEESLKGLFLPGILFEELGFNYIGPIDGHDMGLLIETFDKIKLKNQPVLLHVITKKGKGYEYSEEDPCAFHGIGPFEPETGAPISKSCSKDELSYSEVFGSALSDMADNDPNVVAISAAMIDGTGLAAFSQRHPDRIYDVGIAEPHAVTFAAGMAACGMRPVVAIYSTFLQRSYDEIIHDVCLQKLPVVFAIDRAGIVGEDGPTHQGVFDISYLRHIPDLIVMAPKDADELKDMLAFALKHNGPSAIRYPRGKAHKSGMPQKPIKLGEAELIKEGGDMAIIAAGNMSMPAFGAAERLENDGVNAAVVNARFIKPLDKKLIVELALRTRRIITVEENAAAGGFGASVLECLTEAGLHEIEVRTIGIPDLFVEQGPQATLRGLYGLDENGICSVAVSMMQKSASGK